MPTDHLTSPTPDPTEVNDQSRASDTQASTTTGVSVEPADLSAVQELRVQLIRRGSYGEADEKQLALFERWILTGARTVIGGVARYGKPTTTELAAVAEQLYGFTPTFSPMEMWTDPLPPLTRLAPDYTFDPGLDRFNAEENDLGYDPEWEGAFDE